MSRTVAIALIAIGIVLNNLSYLMDLIAGDPLIYVGWKARLGIVVGVVATIVGIVGLIQGPKRST